MKLYRLLQLVFYYVAPLFVALFVFFDGQETRTKVSMTGLVGLILLFLTFYKRFIDYRKEKLQAHETAKNLGQLSQSVNFTVLAGLNFTFTAIPFIIVLLIDSTLRTYSGNPTLGISFLLLSFGVSEFFGVMYRTHEQKKIQDQLLKKTQEENERIAKAVKGKL